MTGVDGAKEAYRFLAAKLAEKDAVGTQPKRCLKEVVGVDQSFTKLALHGNEAKIVGTVELNFGGVFNDDHALVWGHLAHQRIEKGCLAGRCTAADKDRLALHHRVTKEADRIFLRRLCSSLTMRLKRAGRISIERQIKQAVAADCESPMSPRSGRGDELNARSIGKHRCE